MDIITIAIVSAVLVSTVLKILNIRYEKKIQISAPEQDVNLLNATASQEQFEKVSRESSVLNSPVRTCGDFMDFILESIASNGGIENRILKVNYGEEYGR